MKKTTLAALAALPLLASAAPARLPLDSAIALANQCPEVAALYQPPTETRTVALPGKAPLQVEVPKLGAAPPPLYGAVAALPLFAAAQAEQLPPEQGMFQAVQPMAMPDNTFRSAVMRCDLSEVWVVSRGGVIDSTRWYGPYKLAQLMTARGDAAPPSP
ncbi:hypothetical protein [Pseudoduganella sp.]|uniref:hypothetical protein n=1 Tax=Pseudoduganella sp. TaxID=1880898 RepID=UPI0035B23A86